VPTREETISRVGRRRAKADEPASATVPPASTKEGKIFKMLFARATSRIYFEPQRTTVSCTAPERYGRNRTTHLWVRRVAKVPVVVTIIGAYQKGEKGNEPPKKRETEVEQLLTRPGFSHCDVVKGILADRRKVVAILVPVVLVRERREERADACTSREPP
jgi:hypothetical protein